MSSSARASRLAAAAASVLCGWCLVGGAGCRTAPAPGQRPPESRRTPSRFDLPAHEFIFVGMDARTLKRLVGEPREIAEAREGEEWYYDFGVVVLRGGKVRYKHPPSRAEGWSVPAPPGDEGAESDSADDAQRSQEGVSASP